MTKIDVATGNDFEEYRREFEEDKAAGKLDTLTPIEDAVLAELQRLPAASRKAKPLIKLLSRRCNLSVNDVFVAMSRLHDKKRIYIPLPGEQPFAIRILGIPEPFNTGQRL